MGLNMLRTVRKFLNLQNLYNKFDCSLFQMRHFTDRATHLEIQIILCVWCFCDSECSHPIINRSSKAFKACEHSLYNPFARTNVSLESTRSTFETSPIILSRLVTQHLNNTHQNYLTLQVSRQIECGLLNLFVTAYLHITQIPLWICEHSAFYTHQTS